MARTAATKSLIREIVKCGGAVTVTKRGHLKVSGPLGIAFVSSALSSTSRTSANVCANIRRYAGLNIGV